MHDFGAQHIIETPRGNLILNPAGGADGLYLDAARCRYTVGVRDSDDDTPQKDGAIMHRGFKGKSQVTYVGVCKAEAGTSTRRTILDDLRGKVMSLLRADGRVRWQPAGYSDERLLDDVRVTGGDPLIEGALLKDFQFTLKSPYPYTIDKTQASTALPATLTNLGNTDFWPVIRVTSGTVTLTNTTTGQAFVLSGATPFSSFIEIDMFRETVFADGDQANLTRYIDMAATDFWHLQPGANVITGAGTVLWNHAWA